MRVAEGVPVMKLRPLALRAALTACEAQRHPLRSAVLASVFLLPIPGAVALAAGLARLWKSPAPPMVIDRFARVFPPIRGEGTP